MKAIILLLSMLIFSSLISATSIDIEFPSGGQFEAGQPIIFKATLYDDSGKPINGDIQIKIEDYEKKITNTIIQSTKVATIALSEAASGQGVITAEAEGFPPAIAFFEIGREEEVNLKLEGDNLIITNVGNTPYVKTIKIAIGEVEGTQQVNLEIGESASYRLIAPDGEYNIKVSDGGKINLNFGGVRLSGTGNVVGSIDNSVSRGSGITSNPDEGDELSLIASLQNNRFVYIFVAVIFAGAILVAIERNYKRNTK